MKTLITLLLGVFLVSPMSSTPIVDESSGPFGTCRWKKKDKCKYKHEGGGVYVKSNRYWEPFNPEII